MTTPPTRIQQNMLAQGERRLLNWFCPRIPLWLTPDRLTMIGFLGSLLCSVAYVLSNQSSAWLWLVIPGYLINWFGDSLDGSIARYRKIERPRYGYFIDHSADALSTSILLAAIGMTPHMRLDIAFYALAGYMLLSCHAFIAANVADEFRLSYAAAGPTELRIMLIVMTLLMIGDDPPPVAWNGLTWFDLFGLLIATILVGLFIVQTASTARILRKRGQ
jgi:archaetidylinositol phosphate synthase